VRGKEREFKGTFRKPQECHLIYTLALTIDLENALTAWASVTAAINFVVSSPNRIDLLLVGEADYSCGI
jgi:hypothetical protein